MADVTEETEIFRAQVASRVRMVRKSSDATQEDAAEVCGVASRTYKDYELGRRSMPIEALAKFSKAFKVSVDDLLFGRHVAVQNKPQDTDLVAEVVTGVLSVFGAGGDQDEKEKQIKLACYAWQGARAKGRDFSSELSEVKALMS